MQTFDTYEYIQELQKADVPLKQAEAHSNALKQLFDLDELATKRDLNDLETKLNTKIDGLATELNTKIDSEISDLKTELNTKIDNLESKLNTKIDNLESKLNTKISDLKTELNTKIDNLESKLNTKISDLKTELNTKIDQAIISLIKWLVPMLLGQAALIIALLKYFGFSPAGG